MILAKAITITDEHMLIVGAIVVAILAILGLRKWVRKSSEKRQLALADLLERLGDKVSRNTVHDLEATLRSMNRELGDSTVKLVRETIAELRNAHGRLSDGIADKLTDSIGLKIASRLDQTFPANGTPLPALQAPPANDPGFFKPVALDSKIGDLNELRARLGSSKLDHLLHDAGLSKLASFEEIKRSLPWNTYGPQGSQPLTPVRLIECDTNHLENILATQKHLTLLQYHVIIAILRDRWLAGGTNKNVPLGKFAVQTAVQTVRSIQPSASVSCVQKDGSPVIPTAWSRDACGYAVPPERISPMGDFVIRGVQR